MGLGCGVWRREIVEGRLLQQARDYNETGRRESKDRGNDQPMSLEGDGRIDGDIFISNSVVICRWEDACGTVWVLRRCFTVLSAPSDAPSSEHLPLFSLSLFLHHLSLHRRGNHGGDCILIVRPANAHHCGGASLCLTIHPQKQSGNRTKESEDHK